MRRARIGGAVAPPAHCVQGCAMRTRPSARVCKRRYRPVSQRRPRPSGAAVWRRYRARGAIRRNRVRRLQTGRRGVACAAHAMRNQRGRGAAELRDVGDPDADDPRLRGAVADPAQHRLGKGACDPNTSACKRARTRAQTRAHTKPVQHLCAQRPRAFTQSPERGRMARGAPAQTGGLGTEFEATRALCACTQSPQPCVDGRPHDVQTELATCPRPRTHVLREHDAMKGQPPAAGDPQPCHGKDLARALVLICGL